MKISTRSVCNLISLALCVAVSAPLSAAEANQASSVTAKRTPKKIDRSGKPQRGKASYYSHKFAGKKMADGTPMNPNANIAASRTLPLGTVAEVTNLENGKSAVVEIRDRGPYVDGRIVDLSPKVAKHLEIQKEGVAPVEVRPLELPSPTDSSVSASGDSGTSGTTASGK